MFAAARTLTTAVAPRAAPRHRRRAVRARAEKPSWAPGFDTPKYLDGSMPWCVKIRSKNERRDRRRRGRARRARARASATDAKEDALDRPRGARVERTRGTGARARRGARAGRIISGTTRRRRGGARGARKEAREARARKRWIVNERARAETDGEAVRRRAIAITGSTRSSSAKSRRTSRATARRSSCTRDGPCSASPV